MNFFKNRFKARNYFKILNKSPKTLDKKFVLTNFGSLIGDKSLYKIIVCFELLNLIKNVKGDIIEFGIWNGNNLFALKKMQDYLNLNRKIYGYDNFSGFPNPPRIKKNSKNKKKGIYSGNKDLINFFKKFFKLEKIEIIDDDILNLDKHLNKFSKLSFIYIDCDIYSTTKKILHSLNKKLSVGGLIVFDEGICGKSTEEPKALREFFKNNQKKYKRILLKKGYQPDVYLKKLKN